MNLNFIKNVSGRKCCLWQEGTSGFRPQRGGRGALALCLEPLWSWSKRTSRFDEKASYFKPRPEVPEFLLAIRPRIQIQMSARNQTDQPSPTQHSIQRPLPFRPLKLVTGHVII